MNEQVDLFELGGTDPLMETLGELKNKDTVYLTINRKKVKVSKNLFNGKVLYEFETDEVHEPSNSIEGLYAKLKVFI